MSHQRHDLGHRKRVRRERRSEAAREATDPTTLAKALVRSGRASRLILEPHEGGHRRRDRHGGGSR